MSLSFGEMITGLRRDFFRWRGTRRPPALLPEPPPLRMSIRSALRAAAWYPAKSVDGTLQMQIVVNLECTNKTSSPVRVISARLRDHGSEQTALFVGTTDSQHVAGGQPIPSHGKAHVRVTFFVKGRPHAPGEWFNDVVIIVDEEGREHRLKIAVRGY